MSKNDSGKRPPGSAATAIFRHTPQLRAVYDAFFRQDRPLSPTEVLELSRAEVPALSLATVYRLIKKLLAQHKLVAVGLPNQAPRYEVAGKAHHHHFLCLRCDRIYELHACLSEIQNLAPAGFSVQQHDVLLQGLCQTCVTADA